MSFVDKVVCVDDINAGACCVGVSLLVKVMLWILLFTTTVLLFCVNASNQDNGVQAAIMVLDGDVIKAPVDFMHGFYLKNQDMVWKLVAETGVWGLIFRNFSLENSTNCQFDYFEVLELTETSIDFKIPPSRYCGNVHPHPYVSKNSRVQLRFVSDNIWESSGFAIQAIHFKSGEGLREKLRGMKKWNEEHSDFLSAASSTKEQDGDDPSPIGPIFYVLIGSSSAALLIFISLFIYFIINTFLRRGSRGQHEPVVFFSTTSQTLQAQSTNTVTSRTGRPTKRWRRYSRDRGAPTRSDTLVNQGHDLTTCQMSQKDLNTNNEFHHNNIYVTPI